MKKFIAVLGVFWASVGVAVELNGLQLRQRCPNDGKIDITVSLSASATELENWACAFSAIDSETEQSLDITRIEQVGGDIAIGQKKWVRNFVWDVKSDIGETKVGKISISAKLKAGDIGGVQLWENGPYWAECNIGAEEPEESGCYFRWGDTVGYTLVDRKSDGMSMVGTWVSSDGVRMVKSPFSFEQGPTEEEFEHGGYIDENGRLVEKYDAASVHLGTPWRMPTAEEIEQMKAHCSTKWTRKNGVYGLQINGSGECSSQNIFLPAAGSANDVSLLNMEGSEGAYWTSAYGYCANGVFIYFQSMGDVYSNLGSSFCGHPVRPVRDFAAEGKMELSAQLLFDGGPYTEDVNGVSITFEVVNGGAWIGTSNSDQGVPEATSGRVTIPATLGGCAVVGIHDSAFYRCRSITELVFEGDEPKVEAGGFSKATIGKILVAHSAKWPKPLPATWQGFPIAYIATLNSQLAVTPSRESGTFAQTATLALSAPEGCAIYYTLDGSEPTSDSSVYSKPLKFSQTATVKFFAVDSATRDWGLVDKVELKRVQSPDSAIVVMPSAPDGTVFMDGESFEVTLTAGEGEKIYYWLDDSSSMKMEYCGPISIMGTTTLKFYAENEFGDWSPVQSATYVMQRTDGTGFSERVDGVDFSFDVEDGRARITQVNKSGTGMDYSPWSLIIPEKLGNCPVTAFGRDMSVISYSFVMPSTVVFPETLEEIGRYALSMTELSSIKVPKSVKFIGYGAFVSNDNGMADKSPIMIVMEGNAPEVEEDNGMGYMPGMGEQTPFSSRSTVYVHKGSTGWKVPIPGTWFGAKIRYWEDTVFSEVVNNIHWNYRDFGDRVALQPKADVELADVTDGRVDLPSVVSGKKVETIGKGLLRGAENVTAVTIPDTVKTIESSAFRECTRLETIELPEGLEEIGDSAFERCASLRSIVIPASVKKIGYFAFRDCLRLETIELKGEAPRQDLGTFMGVPAFTTISGRLGSATAIVYASVTNKTDEITVPEKWLDELSVAYGTPAGYGSYEEAFKAKFGEDLAVALKKPTGKHDLKGNALMVWQDYVAGTNPLDEEDVFKATLIMENGLPVVKWTPELPPEQAVLRKYTTYGATALNGAWVDVSALSNEARHAAGYQFFRVTVEMK